MVPEVAGTRGLAIAAAEEYHHPTIHLAGCEMQVGHGKGRRQTGEAHREGDGSAHIHVEGRRARCVNRRHLVFPGEIGRKKLRSTVSCGYCEKNRSSNCFEDYLFHKGFPFFPRCVGSRFPGPESAKSLAGKDPPPVSDPFSGVEFGKNLAGLSS
jgi:hypothetical protein